MSTDVIYDKQFIKADKFFVPMIFGGSTNCIQYDKSSRGRRERSWYNDSFITEGKRIATSDEILAKVQSIRDEYKARHAGGKDESGFDNDTYNDKNFGYFASLRIGSTTMGTTFGKFKGLYVTGMAKALTIEQLEAENVSVNVHMYDFNRECINKAEAAGIPWLEPITITSTAHLLETIKLFVETYKDTKFSWYIGYNEYNLEEKMKRIRAKYFPTRRGKGAYEFVDVDHYYTLGIEGGSNYFVKRTKYGYKYTSYPYRKFATEKEAKAVQNRMKSHMSLTVELVSKSDRIRVLKK